MAELPREVLDALVKAKSKEEIFGPDGLLKQITGALVNRLLESEMDSHLGYEKGARASEPRANHRNGKSRKTVRSEEGPIDIEVPRDRDGTFEPRIFPKHSRDIGHLQSKILYLYASDNTVRTIQDQLKEMYGTEVSADFISRVTDGSWRRSARGEINRSIRCILSCTSTRSG